MVPGYNNNKGNAPRKENDWREEIHPMHKDVIPFIERLLSEMVEEITMQGGTVAGYGPKVVNLDDAIAIIKKRMG